MHSKLFFILTLSLLTSAHTTPKHVDVAIVGGGLSGVATAKEIAKAGKSFAVLEARDRLGGRILNHEMSKHNVQELGAEFVGPTQDKVLALAKELNLTTYATYTKGQNVFYRNNTAHKWLASDSTGGVPPIGPAALKDLAAAMTLLDGWAAELNVAKPWEHAQAQSWDSMTLQTFADEHLTTADVTFCLKTAITSVFSTEMSELSLLYAISYIASAGNETMPGTLGRLIGTHGGAQDSRINGGTQLLVTELAKSLGLGNFHLKAPVRKITRRSDGTYLVEADGYAVTAGKVVVAMSPPLASRIIYNPPLSAGRDQLTQRMAMGAIGKAIAIYPKPWWRDIGLNAQAVSDKGVIHSTFDNTPPSRDYGAIMGFIEADDMRKLDGLSEREVKKLVGETLVDIFGPEAGNYTSIVLQRWDFEEFSRGGPVANAGPGLLTQYGPYLSKPFEGIHFAGTETADFWKGYMDGAIRSAERVAKEVLGAY